jgi:hypothetical protein
MCYRRASASVASQRVAVASTGLCDPMPSCRRKARSSPVGALARSRRMSLACWAANKGGAAARISGGTDRPATPRREMRRPPQAHEVLTCEASGPRWQSENARRQFMSRSRVSASCFAVAVCLMVLTMAGACADKGPTEPSDIYQGLWTGTIVDREGGAGTLRIDLPGGSPLSGTWAAILPVASPIGIISSEPVTTPQRSLALSCGVSGSIGLSALVNGKTMTGSYLAIGCGLSSGSITLMRQ